MACCLHLVRAALVFCLLATPSLVLSQSLSQSLSQPAEIVRAMRDEIARSMKDLYLPSLERPYYVQYTVADRQQYDIRASFGSLTESKHTNEKRLSVTVRVGTPEFDNTNFFDAGLNFFGSSDDEERFRNRQIPAELDYTALRRELWLATDAAYKQSAELYAKKQAALKNRVRLDTVPDFTKLAAATAADTTTIPAFDKPFFEGLAKQLSAVFRGFPLVSLSNVTIQFLPSTTYYVSSEGREYAKTEMLSVVEMVATAQAQDGMPVAQTFTAFAKKPQDLPTQDSLLKAARLLAQKLTQAVGAPVVSTYSGPVLFEEQAAAEALLQAFAPNLVTQRSPITERGVSDNPRFASFQNKVGGRVLPEFLSVSVAPTKTTFAATPLVGSYTIDDEGVAAENFTIVNKGYLKSLMSSRTPTRRIKSSNGHHRGGAAMMSVVELSATKQRTLPAKKLRERLLQLCKDRELPYGIVVRQVLNQNILYYNLYTMTEGEFPFAKGDGQLTALEVYKVFPDGREERVRGAEIAGLAPQAFKDIVAVGEKKFAYNCLAQAVTPPFFSGGEQFLPTSAIVPAMLFEDVEVRPIEDDFAKPPILPHPFFSSKR